LRPSLSAIHGGTTACDHAKHANDDHNPGRTHIDLTPQAGDQFRAPLAFATVVTMWVHYGLCGLM
jgi:hypothetical protein